VLYDIPTPILVIALLAGMIAVVEGGLYVGKRYGHHRWTNAREIHTALTAAALALLGLMLAFTFNLSAGRYDTRKNLVISEAAAIQSVRTSLDFLAPAPRASGLQLLQHYTGKRIIYMKVGHDPVRESFAIDQARALFGDLWRLAVASDNYATAEPQLRAAQYAELTGAMLDLNRVAREREEARYRTVPQTVIVMLFLLAIGAGGVLSYMSGATGHPDRLPTYAFLLLVCLVIYLIIDFDRPRRGLLQFDAAPLERVFNG
jgi:hypothetical protein